MSMFRTASADKAFAKILLFGKAGTGKTRTIIRFPEPAIIDTEGGAELFVHKFGEFPIARIRSYTDILKALTELRTGSVPGKTMGLDSLTNIYTGLQSAAMDAKNRQFLSMTDWAPIKRKFRQLIDVCYDRSDRHVIMTAHEKSVFAKEGDVIGGKTVGKDDVFEIGATPDCEKKADHGFDFVFRTCSNGNGDYWVEVYKARGDIWARGTVLMLAKGGQEIATLYSILEPYVRGTSGAVTPVYDRKTEDEAAAQDAELFFDRDPQYRESEPPSEPAKPPATVRELADEFIALTSSVKLTDAEKTDLLQKTLGRDKIGKPVRTEWVTLIAAMHDIRTAREAAAQAVATTPEPPTDPVEDAGAHDERDTTAPAEAPESIMPHAAVVDTPVDQPSLLAPGEPIAEAAKPETRVPLTVKIVALNELTKQLKFTPHDLADFIEAVTVKIADDLDAAGNAIVTQNGKRSVYELNAEQVDAVVIALKQEIAMVEAVPA